MTAPAPFIIGKIYSVSIGSKRPIPPLENGTRSVFWARISLPLFIASFWSAGIPLNHCATLIKWNPDACFSVTTGAYSLYLKANFPIPKRSRLFSEKERVAAFFLLIPASVLGPRVVQLPQEVWPFPFLKIKGVWRNFK